MCKCIICEYYRITEKTLTDREIAHYHKGLETNPRYKAKWEKRYAELMRKIEAGGEATAGRPSLFGMAKNFGKAVINHVKDGMKAVSKKEYERRLSICKGDENTPACPFYNNNRCDQAGCGCFLTKKAKMRSEECPIGKW